MNELPAIRSLAEEIAREAGAFLLAGIDKENIEVDTKSTGTDMVSEMDRGAERLIVDAILATRPHDGLLGEEGASSAGTSGYRWVIDPLDGTTNYLYRHPLWSVSIGVEFEGVPVVGVVNGPMLQSLFSAHTGGGATRNGTPLHVGSCDDLGFALVGTGFGYKPEMREWQGQILHVLLPEVRDVRRGGSAALDLCFVGAGNYDGYYERNSTRGTRAPGP
jgi:myo-inositol-1(or 4)-monophosphatase